MTRAAGLGLAAVLAAGAAGAAPPVAEPVAIEHATVCVPAGAPLKDATLLLADGKVRAVGAGVAVPAGARRIDARGKVVTAGLIDLGQAGVVEVASERAGNDADPSGGAMVPSFRMRDGYDPRSPVIPISRAGGVTSVVLLPDEGLLAGEASLVDLSGDRVAQAVAQGGAAQVVRMNDDTIQSAAGARGAAWQKLRTALEDARFYSTNKAAYDGNRARPLSLPRADLAALEPVMKGQEPLLMVVHRASDIELALGLADDFKLRLVIAGATEAWIMAPELAARKVPVILDPWQNLPASFDSMHPRDDQAAYLAKAGVDVSLATFTTNESRQLWQRAGNAVRFGMDHDAALRAVTDGPARALGLTGYGRLEPGAVANVVVWSGDPLEASSRAERVFVRGAEQPLESRQTMLLRRYRTVPVVRDGTRQ